MSTSGENPDLCSDDQALTTSNTPLEPDPNQGFKRVRHLTTQYMLEGRPELVEERARYERRWMLFWAVVAFICLGTITRALILLFIQES